MDKATNITLTGFMGTGKTTTGRLLAERLGRAFVDMDDRLVAHFGKPIADVFAQDGEAVFRTAEAQLCQALAAQTGLVIATGGGALVNGENRDVLAASGPVLCLTADAETIIERVEAATDRPLLPGGRAEKLANIENLLARRRGAYGSIPLQIPTDRCAPDVIVERVLDALAANDEVAGMNRISVATPEGTTYHICIAHGLLAQVGQLMADRGLVQGKAAIVTNPVIARLHGDRAAESLAAAGFEPVICTVPEGEQHKTLASIASLYDQFLAAGLDRRSPVVGLGGGVIGDMAGFAAASYLRGVPFVQIPTSVLSMVDASVGGKTGVDLPQGKNLVGAFKQPSLVVIDPAVVESLPAAEFRSGLAEIVKHGIIAAPEIFRQLEGDGPASLGQLVSDAVRVKVEVVAEDPFEMGRRATLNLGHTFGHAIEQTSQYAVRHGEGVALGLICAAHMAGETGHCDPALEERIRQLLIRLDLPVSVSGYSLDEVQATMFFDKKRQGKTLRFILPTALGDVKIVNDPGGEFVRRALARVLV
ncbi:MAG: 3-dehydroquinate synthase [Caldilineaceae bacterium]|nr:3-dehydroquinate synthase [Caldilineaceae bacterium]